MLYFYEALKGDNKEVKVKNIVSAALASIFICLLIIPARPVGAAPTVSITSPTANQTVGTSFTVSGTATPSTTVQVRVNGTLAATTISSGAGAWSVDLTGQATGAKTIQAKALSTPLLHVGSYVSTNLLVFDTNSNTQASGSPFDTGSPAMVSGVVSPDGNKVVLFSAAGTDLLRVFDVETHVSTPYTVTGATLGGGAYSSDGSLLYLSDQASPVVHVLETINYTEVNTITVGSGGLGLVISHDNSTLYAAGATEVSVVNLADESFTTISTVNQPVSLLINNKGDRLYASHNTGPGNLSVIDTASKAVITTIVTSGDGLGDMAILPNDSKLYVSCTQSGVVSVINTSNNTEITTITVGAFPYGLDTTSDGKVYHVSLGDIFGDGSNAGVWEINPNTDTANEFFSSDDGSFGPLSAGRFIAQPSALTAVNVTVAGSTLASTGSNQTVVLYTALALIGVGAILIRRYSFSR